MVGHSPASPAGARLIGTPLAWSGRGATASPDVNRPIERTRRQGVRYVALGCDYDGTLATDGRVGANVIAALGRVRASGRKLVMVTGRELDDLLQAFPRLDLF